MNPRDEQAVGRLLAKEIAAMAEKSGRTLRFMEVCGTHTMAIHQSGLKSLLPQTLTLVSGPGCPVCVTEKSFIDEAILMGRSHAASLVTFGDLVRVPGSLGSLGSFRSEGGMVRVVYSPLDMIEVAVQDSQRPTVFLGVGFETTVPTVAATLKIARDRNINNLFVLTAFKTIHPPLKLLAGKNDLDGFLLPGHVSAVIGSASYQYLANDFKKSGVVAGFESLDILLALRDLTRLTVERRPAVLNDYRRVVKPEGNKAAQTLIEEVFEPCDAYWRGLGVIPGSGLTFTEAYKRFDARYHLPVKISQAEDDPRCRCAAILTGNTTPDRCGLFGRECTPETPVGPCMVSSEGTCAAYYKYGVS